MQAVSLWELHTSGLPGLRNRRAHLQSLKLLDLAARLRSLKLADLAAHLHNLKLVDPTVHHTRAQILLHRTRKARRKAAMALQAPDLLERRMLVLKANPAVEATHLLQALDLLVHQIRKIKANPAVGAVYYLQAQLIRQWYPSSHRPRNQRHKVALRKQKRLDQCQVQVPNLPQAVSVGHTILSSL